MVLAPATDPGPYQFLLEKAKGVKGVHSLTGDTDDGWDQAVSAFTNGYDVVVTDLFFDHSKISKPAAGLTSEVTFSGFQLIEDGWNRARAAGTEANYVVLSEWDHQSNVYESYRRFARAFISKRHPLSASDFVESTMAAAKNISTYPNMPDAVRNIAIAISNASFGVLNVSDLEIVDCLVNGLTTKETQMVIDSKSPQATTSRIGKIMKKVGLKNRDELISHAVDIGMTKHDKYSG